MNLLNRLINACSQPEQGITFVYPSEVELNLTYCALYDEALLLLGAFQQRGLKPGHELIIQVEDNKQFLCVFWACLMGRIIPVPLSAGVQVEQKLKLLNVWQCLCDPWLLCDEQQLQRIRSAADPAGIQYDHEQLQQRTILTAGLAACSVPGIPEHIQEDDIAYIQFSSGSTGDPKGVRLTHRNLLSNVEDIIAGLAITKRDVLLSWMPLTHDMGMIGFHLAGIVSNTAAVSIPTSLFIRRPLLWMDKVSSHRASVLYSPNFGLQYFLSAYERDMLQSWQLSCVRIIVNGAEPIAASLCHAFTERLAVYGLRENCMVAAYGLAEASVAVAIMPVHSRLISHCLHRDHLNTGDAVMELSSNDAAGASFVDVGYPVSTCSVRVCNDQDVTLADNRIGHVQIKGANVTDGYYNNADATGRLFTADGWLRTGDMGFLRNGRLIITGRQKNIIIINGRNYYPQDIEQVIMNAGMPALKTVVACAGRNFATGREELLVFFLYRQRPEESKALVTTIRDTVAAHIGITVDKVIPVKKIPKTTSGKVQHFALLEQYRKGIFDQEVACTDKFLQQSPVNAAGSGDTIKEQLLAYVKELLGNPLLDQQTGLHAAGISSIAATRLTDFIYRLTGTSLPVSAVFKAATVEDLAGMLQVPQEQQLRLAASPVSGNSVPLSLAQKRIWMECQLQGHAGAYHIPVACTIYGPLHLPLLEKAFHHLIKQYEILRTSFETVAGAPVQKVHPWGDTLFSIQVTNLAAEQDPLATAREMISGQARAALPLDKPAQYRACLYTLQDDVSVFCFIIHHILVDGWSLSVLFTALSTIYTRLLNGLDPGGPEQPAFQYRDYVYWQQQLIETEMLSAHRAYWLQELQHLPRPAEFGLPDAVQLPYEGIRTACCRDEIRDNEMQVLSALAKQHGTTMFVILMSALNALLYRYTGSRDILTGFDSRGRTPEMSGLIGYVLNTLCLRMTVEPDHTFGELVHTVKEKVAAALTHQWYPFELLLKEKELQRPLNGAPLFNILVLYQDFYQEAGALTLEGCHLKREQVDTTAGLTDLVLEFIWKDERIEWLLHYNTALYTENIIKAFTIHLRNMLVSVAADPQAGIARIGFLTSEEKQIVLPDVTLSPAAEGLMPLHLQFEQQAALTPENTAVVGGTSSLTYRALNEQANAVARYLLSTGLQPEDRIGFMLKRDVNIVVAILGILKAGGAFVPVEPELPAARKQHMMQDSGMKLLLTDDIAATTDGIPKADINGIRQQAVVQAGPAVDVSPAQLAYVLYTSGSTGMPKGVMVEQHSITDYVRQFVAYFGITAADTVIQQSSVAFDTMLEEIFPALLTGARVVIAPNGARDIEGLLDITRRYHATVLSTTPLVLSELNRREQAALSSIRLFISGGDVLRPSHIDQLLQHAVVCNTYGPTEATICAAYHMIRTPEEAMLIGTPVSNRRIYILDGALQPVPAGKIGTIYIAGGLARGYLHLPELTAERFIDNPFVPGERLYCSGDKGWWTAQGRIAFAGRQDFQVKIRGYRVEPEEIEAAILRYPHTLHAAVVKDPQADRLIAFITAMPAFDELELRSYISAYLPYYMLPAAVILLPEMPVTITGKTNRVLLEKYAVDSRDHEQEPDAQPPANPMEVLLISICQELLQREPIGSNSNFFEAGGDSIKAYQLQNRIFQETGIEIKLSEIFIYPVIRQLADLVLQVEKNTFDYISLD